MITEHEELLQALNERLDRGAQEYGDRSFLRPLAETERQILEEALDQIGWVWILWAQSARKAGMFDPRQSRDYFLDRLRHRLARNDRRDTTAEVRTCRGLCDELEVLAMDLVDHYFRLARRLAPIVRAIEVAPRLYQDQPRGRRGSTHTDRSSD